MIDDDLLLFPGQISMLFRRLVEQPQIPHGLIGRFNSIYYLNREMEVDNLYEVYAATHIHARQYSQLVEKITACGYASRETIENWAQDIILSHTGHGRPRIHDAGYLLRCPTTTKKGVATYRKVEFQPRRKQVRSALARLRLDGELHLSAERLFPISKPETEL